MICIGKTKSTSEKGLLVINLENLLLEFTLRRPEREDHQHAIIFAGA